MNTYESFSNDFSTFNRLERISTLEQNEIHYSTNKITVFQQRFQSIFQFHEIEPRFARFSIRNLRAATFVSFLTQPK